MWTTILIALAAFFNACMDTIAHHSSVSIFNKLPEPFRTYMLRGWRARYVNNDPKTGKFKTYKVLFIPIKSNWIDGIHDGWHLCKTLMIISICLAPVVYNTITGYWWADFLIYGITWNVVFVLFYDKVLR